jgi:hypothetical protein
VEDSTPVARKHLFDAIPPNRWKAIALSVVRVAIGLGFMWWLYSLVPKDVDERIFIPGVLLLVGLAVYVWFVKKEIERILGSRYPEVLAVEGLILSAALFMVIFATIYLVIDGLNPGSFTEPLTHLSSHYGTDTRLLGCHYSGLLLGNEESAGATPRTRYVDPAQLTTSTSHECSSSLRSGGRLHR